MKDATEVEGERKTTRSIDTVCRRGGLHWNALDEGERTASTVAARAQTRAQNDCMLMLALIVTRTEGMTREGEEPHKTQGG